MFENNAIWQLQAPVAADKLKPLVKELSIPPLLAAMLLSRGFDKNAKTQLNPKLKLSKINDLVPAAERLVEAIKSKKRILIHGDYDADGITATALLTLGLRALGANVQPFIPHRLNEGYGIHPSKVPEHIENSDLFLTVDCGVSNLEEIAALQAAGIEVIISDHHQPGQELPNCLVVHPKMAEDHKIGQAELTGSGVAYHLLWAVHRQFGIEAPIKYSDIASIGIIADVAPLLGENRALIMLGLEQMQNSAWPGLRAAIKQSGIKAAVTAKDVAFVLAPRLNAAGRLGEAELGLELLMTNSERRARELAVYLDTRNIERRKIQDDMFEEALLKVDTSAAAIVLDDNSWHPGVMGIVASKILEKYYKPVFIIAQGKGSVRSTPGISAVKALDYAAKSLKRYGGHSQAAGFAIADDKIDDFRFLINEFVAKHDKPKRIIKIDSLIDATKINTDLYDALGRLEPYGQGHPSPVFALSGRLEIAKAVGKNANTLQLRIGGKKGVAWQKGTLADKITEGVEVEAIISLQENNWQNKRSIEFIAEDLRLKTGFSLEDSNCDYKITRNAARIEGEVVEIDNLDGLEQIPTALKANKAINIRLSPLELEKLEQKISNHPTLANLRTAFVTLRKNQNIPYNEHKTERIIKILKELKLLDGKNRLVNKKIDPYLSETFVNGLIESYKQETFLKAYRYLDDAGFAKTICILWK